MKTDHPQTKNERLNLLIEIADDYCQYDNFDEFERILDLIDRHFYPLSILPQSK